MREELLKQCEMFSHNREEIKSYFKWDNSHMIAVCASELSGRDVKVEVEQLLKCKNILDKSTKLFSTFKGNVKLPVISILAADNNPEAKMEAALEMHRLLKSEFRDSDYLPLLAIKLSEMVSVSEAEPYIKRGKEIYTLMKKNHPFLTSSEDNIFAVLLAFSDKENAIIVEEMEKCYKLLKKFSSDSNAMQSVSHVLTLSEGEAEEKCNKVIELFNAIDGTGKKYRKGFEMAVLAVLSILNVTDEKLIDEIVEVDEFLSALKGYTGLGIDKRTRLMHAVMLVTNTYSQKNVGNTVAITGTLSMIAAQNAAMCAVIASTVAVNASHS